jgi:hypothetical protein
MIPSLSVIEVVFIIITVIWAVGLIIRSEKKRIKKRIPKL